MAPSSAAANVGVPAPSNAPRNTAQPSPHPYANSSGAIQDFNTGTERGGEEAYNSTYAPGVTDGAGAPKTVANGGANAGHFEEETPHRGFFASLCRCG